ncbi:MAG TPA: hypothetical protein DEF27_09180 [Oscillatoriales bacterium UBA8482]|nr:MAG: hypothetical protein AUK43_01210 [Oscillatoriales cyanobacterium CG2_30_40_61]HBW57953.1 hypothetical protein [Oscillatoriales bacterium UBA8482]
MRRTYAPYGFVIGGFENYRKKRDNPIIITAINIGKLLIKKAGEARKYGLRCNFRIGWGRVGLWGHASKL